MKLKTAAMVLMTMCAAAGCKKKGSGGGGGGGWLVGSSGLMANVGVDGYLGAGYDLGSSEELYGISCSGLDVAYVVGAHGSLLQTVDGGESWRSIDAGTDTTLRSVAAWNDSNHVYAVGDDAFLMSPDGGAHWQSLTTEKVNFSAVSSDWRGLTALAISDDGRVWSYDGARLKATTTLAGARSIAVSHDGSAAVAVGDSVWRSMNGGLTWEELDVGPVELRDAWIEADGQITAVGDAGSVLNVAADGSSTLSFPGAKDLRTVFISADGFGVAAGDDGETLMTYDAGASWELGPNVGHTVYAVDQIALNSL